MGLLSRIRRVIRRSGAAWERHAPAYRHLIHDPAVDSGYLRDRGLKPNILDLIPQRSTGRVLDVGCGDGWLFDTINPSIGCECDITQAAYRKRRWPFSLEDVVSLSFGSESFDLIVASLVLMFVEDVQAACDELFRVGADGATLVVALTHPCFYRMGAVLENGQVVIQHDYSRSRVIPDVYIAGKVGPFCYFHRPLSEYFNALIRSGWTIAEFREWSIDMTDYWRHCRDASASPRRTGKLPLYAFLQCKKKVAHDTDRSLRNELDSQVDDR